MMKSCWLGPTILAAAIIGSTVLVSLMPGSGLVLVGPLIMAVALLVVAVLQHRVHGAPRTRIWAAWIMGVAIILAAVILTQRDPARLSSFLPVLGGALAVFLVVSPDSRGRDGGADV